MSKMCNQTPLLRRFGKTGLAFPEIGLGTWTFSGRDFGPVTDKVCTGVISKAVESGVRFFDTADIYGRGRAEQLLGKTFAGMPKEITANLFIATKVGNDFRGFDDQRSQKNFDPDYIREAVENCLERLQCPFLDLLQLHNPPPGTLSNGSLFQLLERWRSEGRIRFVGVSTVEKKDIQLITETDIIDAVQVPFNLLRQELLSECAEILSQWSGAVIIRTPLEFGLLGGQLPAGGELTEKDYRRRAWTPDEEELKRAAVKETAAILTKNMQRTPAQAAIQFALLPRCVSVVIPGARTVSQLTENIAASWGIPALTLAELEEVDRVLHHLGLFSRASSWLKNKEKTSIHIKSSPVTNPLFRPIKLGPLILKNRILRSATTERCADEKGRPNTHLTEMYRKLASGGVGMIITGYTATHQDARASTSHCVIGDGEVLLLWRKIVDTIHIETPGVPLCLQIAQGGSRSVAKPLSPAKGETIIKQFVRAAEQAWEAGFDAVQIHAAHGYLLSQLLAQPPLPRRRRQNHPGVLLLTQLVTAVKAVTPGDRKAVLIKLNMSDFMPGGFGPDDARIVARRLAEIKVDAIEWSGWLPDAAPDDSPSRPGEIRTEGEGFFVPFVSALKKELPSLTMGCCGGFRSAEGMKRALTEEGLDFISLSRPLIAEPDLPNRLARGQTRAYCSGCNACLPRHVRPIHCPTISQSRRPNV